MTTQRVNAWGGAIALGHPLGASGARLGHHSGQSLACNGRVVTLFAPCALVWDRALP